MATKYDFDQIPDRSNSNSVKWEAMTVMDPRANADTLPFWVADMDFVCAPPILEALRSRVEKGVFGYSRPDVAYFSAVCNWYKRRFDWDIPVEAIKFSPGVVPAVSFLIEILSNPGDGIIIQQPVYYPFMEKILAAGRLIVNNALIHERDGYYRMDFDDLREKVKDHKVLVLCSPHNPVGRVWHEDELRTLGEICLDHGVTIISDEIHNDLIRRGIKHTVLETLFPDRKDRIITCVAPSKSFNLAGLQISSVIMHDPELSAKWRQYVAARLSLFLPNPLSIVGAQAAYSEGEEWLEELIDYLDANLAFTEEFIKSRMPKAVFRKPEGTYLIWINVSGYHADMKVLMDNMITHGNVLIEEGGMFGSSSAHFLRMNVACPRSLLEEGLKRMAMVLDMDNSVAAIE